MNNFFGRLKVLVVDLPLCLLEILLSKQVNERPLSEQTKVRLGRKWCRLPLSEPDVSLPLWAVHRQDFYFFLLHYFQHALNELENGLNCLLFWACLFKVVVLHRKCVVWGLAAQFCFKFVAFFFIIYNSPESLNCGLKGVWLSRSISLLQHFREVIKPSGEFFLRGGGVYVWIDFWWWNDFFFWGRYGFVLSGKGICFINVFWVWDLIIIEGGSIAAIETAFIFWLLCFN